MAPLNLQLKYGSQKFRVQLLDTSTLIELHSEVAALTGVPPDGQKLILNGKTLTQHLLDPNVTLRECHVKNGAKIMVLGRRYDPEGDQVYKSIQEVESKSLELNAQLRQIATDLADLENGYLPREHHEQALKQMLKRCKANYEQLMQNIIKLDGFSFDEQQQEAKAKRKSVVNQINAWMDQNDELQRKLKAMVQRFDEATGSK